MLQENGRLADSDRDRIDNDAEKFMKVCHEAIKNFKTQGKIMFKAMTQSSVKWITLSHFDTKATVLSFVEIIVI